MHPLEPVQIVNIASTLVFVPLAVWVLLADRRELANIAFAGHALAFAAVVATHNVNVGTHFLEGTGLL